MIRMTLYQDVQSPGMSRKHFDRIVACTLSGLDMRSADVSVHVVGLAAMRKLNKTHRGLDLPTDVLSFAAREGVKAVNGKEAQNDIGDIFLCAPYIVRQAKRFGISFSEECARMLIHGILHVLGYEHDTPKQAKKMFQLQEKFLQDCV